MANTEWAKKIDQAVMPGMQGGPHMHTIAQKAACFLEAQTPEFAQYQRQVLANAQALARSLQNRGLSCVSGGTDTHLLIIKTVPLGLSGKEAEERLEAIGINSSRSSIPFDRASPLITSGLRLGTPAVTTRGMQEEQMEILAECIYATLCEQRYEWAKNTIEELAHAFPIPDRYL
jgi:glycine hydroxymethyltransferase